jgi:hypothetical protein
MVYAVRLFSKSSGIKIAVFTIILKKKGGKTAKIINSNRRAVAP